MCTKIVAIIVMTIASLNQSAPQVSKIPSHERYVRFTGYPEDCLGAYFLYHDVAYQKWESDLDIREQVDLYVKKHIDFNKDIESVTFSLYGKESRDASLIVFFAYGERMEVKWRE